MLGFVGDAAEHAGVAARRRHVPPPTPTLSTARPTYLWTVSLVAASAITRAGEVGTSVYCVKERGVIRSVASCRSLVADG